MRKGFAVALVVGFLLMLAAPDVGTAKDGKKETTAELLARAAEVSDIRSPSSPPFRLRARVSVAALAKGEVEGSYVLIWNSEKQWREEIVFPGFSQIRVGDGSRFWQVRKPKPLALRVFQMTRILDIQGRLKVLSRETLGSVRQRQRNGVRVRCADVRRKDLPVKSHELCFDLASGALVLKDFYGLAYEYSEHSPWEKKVFPRLFRVVERGKPVVEIQVDELVGEAATDASLFEPPADAEAWDWCKDEIPPEPDQRAFVGFPEGYMRNQMNVDVAVHAVIETDGTLHDPTVVQSAGERLDRAALESVRQSRYRPRMCNGKPVKGETVITF